MTSTLSAHSQEFVRVQVEGTKDGQPVDPTRSPVFMAFTDNGPTHEDWHEGHWETAPGPLYYAACLVGPDAVSLKRGNYKVWVKVSADEETPVISAGTLQVI